LGERAEVGELVSLSLRLKKLLGPVTRVKKKKKKVGGPPPSVAARVASSQTPRVE